MEYKGTDVRFLPEVGKKQPLKKNQPCRERIIDYPGIRTPTEGSFGWGVRAERRDQLQSITLIMYLSCGL